ncbi:MAG: hypothetical protein H0Z28_04715 [Archaeoglobus sp.]|nr:hypothetical protein [Archaeoglobus sp.]
MEYICIESARHVVKNKLRFTAENFFAIILVLKTLSFVKAVLIYFGL